MPVIFLETFRFCSCRQKNCGSISLESQIAVNNNENENQELQHIIGNISI